MFLPGILEELLVRAPLKNPDDEIRSTSLESPEVDARVACLAEL